MRSYDIDRLSGPAGAGNKRVTLCLRLLGPKIVDSNLVSTVGNSTFIVSLFTVSIVYIQLLWFAFLYFYSNIILFFAVVL